jgi:hypothetical protein
VATPVDVVGYVFAAALATALVGVALRERRWWSWLQIIGVALLAADAVAHRSEPAWLGAVNTAAGPPILVAGLLAWRLHRDAGWFGGDDQHAAESEETHKSPRSNEG